MVTLTDLPALSFGVDQVIGMMGEDSGDGWACEVSTSLDFGTFAPNLVDIPSQIFDGSLSVVDSQGNRVLTLYVRFRLTGDDGDALARGESVLMRECGRDGWNALTWQPMIEGAETTVFDVVHAQADYQFSLENELQGMRVYQLTLTCLPYPRSADPVTIPVLPAGGGGTDVVVQDGTSAAKWTAFEGGAPSATTYSGAQCVFQTGASIAQVSGGTVNYCGLQYDPAAPLAVNVATTPYLVVRASQPLNFENKINGVNGTGGTYLSVLGSTSDGTWTTYWFQLPAGLAQITELRFGSSGYGTAFGIDYVNLSSAGPSDAQLGKSSVRTLDVVGAVRSEVSLHVAARAAVAGTSLGKCIIYNDPQLVAGFYPSLRKFRTSTGTVSADSTAVSGSYDYLNSGTLWTAAVPARTVPPGTYVLYGLVATNGSNANVTFTTTAATTIGTQTVATQTRTAYVAGLRGTPYSVVALGTFTLPTTDVPGQASSATVTFTVSGDYSSILLDDVLTFRKSTDTALTIVDLGTGSTLYGTNYNHLWIYPPSMDRKRPALYIGTAADGSDQHTPDASRVVAWGTHKFRAGQNGLYVATSNSTRADVSGTYPPRWGHHAEKVA